MKIRTLVSILILVLAVLLVSSCATISNVLFVPVSDGDHAETKRLIEEGADVNTKNKAGWTALMLASLYGHTEVAKLLIEAGTDIDAQTKRKGFTALMWATGGGGHTEVVKLLIEAGADVNAQTKLGTTALMGASRTGYTEIVKLLIEAGADIDAKDNNGATALMIASSEEHTEIVKLLKEAGAKE